MEIKYLETKEDNPRRIEYVLDEKKFEIKIIDEYGIQKVNIYNKQDNRLLASFNVVDEPSLSTLKFIYRNPNLEYTDFYIGRTSFTRKNSTLTSYIFHDNGTDLAESGFSSLHKRNEYNIHSTSLEEVCINGQNFIVDGKGVIEGAGTIYTAGLEGSILSIHRTKPTEHFSRIFRNKEDSKIIYVERKIATKVPEVCDYIVYGIDSDTLEIATKIYSKNKDKYIDILDEEQIEEESKRIWIMTKVDCDTYGVPLVFDNPLEATISLRIKLPLCYDAEEYSCAVFDKVAGFISEDTVKKLGTYPGADTKEENK